MPSGRKKVKKIDSVLAHAKRVYDAVHGNTVVYCVTPAGRAVVNPTPNTAVLKKTWMERVCAEIRKGAAYYVLNGVREVVLNDTQLADLVGGWLVHRGSEYMCTVYAAPDKQFKAGAVRVKGLGDYLANDLMRDRIMWRGTAGGILHACWNEVPNTVLIT